ncbi:MLO-like protein 6 [Pyrus ussuriensis x Pyrus communis]|uniref:MLO-like protein 6 n=1 Tax=Pyrus ussuriensis x Pyrus communis TaxID=2448454 RepID=A0A5N5G5V3_9ROSA|nr:MLO-like protein 6 [Pyrus ussuriensis x Pyrus communis]
MLMLHALPSLPSTMVECFTRYTVILGLCQQRRVVFMAHHHSVQHSSIAVLVGQDRISDMCTSKAVEATWHPCNNKQDVKSDKAKDKSGASDDNSGRRFLSALDSSGGWPMLNVSYSCSYA